MAEHKITNEDATPGVGFHEWGGNVVRRARMMRGIGGVLLAVSVVGLVLSVIGITFGLAPLAFLVLLLLPLAFLGGWLRGHGAMKLRQLRAQAARRGESLEAT